MDHDAVMRELHFDARLRLEEQLRIGFSLAMTAADASRRSDGLDGAQLI
jgi:hypothetical protein